VKETQSQGTHHFILGTPHGGENNGAHEEVQMLGEVMDVMVTC
jgi:hypothetical protein